MQNVFSQYLDTLHEVFTSRSMPDFRLESRWSFLEKDAIRISGFRLGVSFRKKLRIGGGISWISSDFTQNTLQLYPDGNYYEVKQFLNFFYLCYYIDFVFYKTRRWQLSTPVQVGLGSYWWTSSRKFFLKEIHYDHFLFLYEPGINVQYKILPFLGLGMDAAYRFGSADSGMLKRNFFSPVYALKLLIWFDQLFFWLFPESKPSRTFGSNRE